MTLFLTNQEVELLADYGEIIPRLEAAYRAQVDLSELERQTFSLSEEMSYLYILSGHLPERRVMGAKLVSLHVNNVARGLPRIRGVLVLMDATDGSLLCVMEAESLTAIRTASSSAVASLHLANPGPQDLGFLGVGTQARAHLEALGSIFEVDRICAFDVVPERIEGFLQAANRFAKGRLQAMGSAAEVVAEATIVVAATTSKEPVIRGSWLKPGQHIISIACTGPNAAEVDVETIRRSRIISDSLDTALRECGDFVLPFGRDDPHLAERGLNLADVVSGRAPGRTSAEDITLYKSAGSFIQDGVVGDIIYRKATKESLGRKVLV